MASSSDVANIAGMNKEMRDRVVAALDAPAGFMEGWKQQLKSPIAPMAIPRSLTGYASGLSGSTMAGAVPDFNAFAPWTIWLQAAEIWQRTWMPDVPKRGDTRSH
jgi:hypothetical protein